MIKVGQTVNVKLNNYLEYEFGVLKGKVKNISILPDRNGLYNVDVELTKELITTYNKKSTSITKCQQQLKLSLKI